jgi:hypothetical protein
LENSPRKAGAACGAKGNPRLDSHDEPRQFSLEAARIHGELLKLDIDIDIGETV